MSKLKSPKAAAKRAERDAEKIAEIRKLKRKSWIWLGFVIFAMIAAIVGDWIFIRSSQRQHHQQHHHRGEQTNVTTSAMPAQTNEPRQK